MIGRKSAGNVRGELCSYADCYNFGKLIGIDALVAVRISSTLLKPAVLLLLGASGVLGCAAANALMIVNAYTSGTGTVIDFSGTIDTSGLSLFSSNTNPSRFQAGGLTTNAVFVNNTSGIVNRYNFSPSSAVTDVGSLDTVFVATSSIGDSFGFNLSTSPNSIVLASNYVSGSALAGSQTYSQSLVDLGLTAGTSYNITAANNLITFNVFSSNPAAAPAPLPILGLPAVLFYSRKLKKRIKESRETSSNALI